VDTMTTGLDAGDGGLKLESSPRRVEATEALEKEGGEVVQSGEVVVRGEMGRRRSVGREFVEAGAGGRERASWRRRGSGWDG